MKNYRIIPVPMGAGEPTPGPQGAQGYQGYQGPAGADGQNGAQGYQGYQGNAGQNGTNGQDGAQGYQGYQGYQGNAGQNGTNGQNGAQGYQGYQGPAGTNGTNGQDGAQGYQGYQGPAGTNGTNGQDGAQGYQGYQGYKGEDGTSVRILPNAESCTQLGDGYIDSNGHLQVLTNLDPRTFTDVGAIKGPQGNDGAQGYQGYQGYQGNAGQNGTNGQDGAQGYQGYQGSKGETGSQGADGQNGAQGYQGYQGYQGNAGQNGTNGQDGAQGYQGYQGYQGNAGQNGTNGQDGAQGYQGYQGYRGPGREVYELSTMSQSDLVNFYNNYTTLITQNTYTLNGYAFTISTTIQQGATLLVLEYNSVFGSNATDPTVPIDTISVSQKTYLLLPNGVLQDYSANGMIVPTTNYLATVAHTGDYNDLVNKPTVTQGYQGYQGPAGTNGTNGAQGYQGYQGPAGTAPANVATLDGNNAFTGSNTFDNGIEVGDWSNQIISVSPYQIEGWDENDSKGFVLSSYGLNINNSNLGDYEAFQISVNDDGSTDINNNFGVLNINAEEVTINGEPINVQGTQGYQGYQGSAGTNGTDGVQGYQGYQGIKGEDGAQGADGTNGQDGAQGYQGYQGSAGQNGTNGAQGADGTQGYQGYQGYQGPGREVYELSTMSQADLVAFYNNYATLITQNTYVLNGYAFTIGTTQQQGATLLVLEYNSVFGSNATDPTVPVYTISVSQKTYLLLPNGTLQDYSEGKLVVPTNSYLATVAHTGDYNDLINKPVVTQGYQGYQGYQGSAGTNGTNGAQGYQGYKGEDGTNGAQGYQGYQGSAGTNGVQGYQGYQGASGGVISQVPADWTAAAGSVSEILHKPGTVTMVVTFTDQTTATYNVYADTVV